MPAGGCSRGSPRRGGGTVRRLSGAKATHSEFVLALSVVAVGISGRASDLSACSGPAILAPACCAFTVAWSVALVLNVKTTIVAHARVVSLNVACPPLAPPTPLEHLSVPPGNVFPAVPSSRAPSHAMTSVASFKCSPRCPFVICLLLAASATRLNTASHSSCHAYRAIVRLRPALLSALKFLVAIRSCPDLVSFLTLSGPAECLAPLISHLLFRLLSFGLCGQ